jgi:hypothetical protein
MTRLFSYVLAYDEGFAPNPYGDFCTLVHCKFSSSGRPNIVELAQVGDWVAGTGGVNYSSAGHGRLIYAMRVDEKLTLKQFSSDRRFAGRANNWALYARRTNRFALVSKHFFYFGEQAVDISRTPAGQLDHSFEKSGRGFRSDFSEAFIAEFALWLERTYPVGVHGDPCGGRPPHATSRPVCRPRSLSRSLG